MQLPPHQQFLASNAVSLAQAWLYRDNGDVFPFAIYADDLPVGFMLLEEDAQARTLALWRMMIAPAYQGRGFSRQAVCLLLRLAADSGKYRAIGLNCAPDNHAARHLYESLGFRPTGERCGEDVILQLPF